MRSFGFRLLAAIAISLQWAAPSWARVGVTSVIDGQPKGLPPQGVERILSVGNDMQPNERVTTGANDKAYIVFLDGTSLTVGPNSVLTIDKFVYDPQRKTGELALNASRGVFRVVGGAISKNSEINVKTPSATMGIRGGIATVAVTASGATTANFLFGGSLTVTSQGVTHTTTQPGSQIRVPVGAPPTPPVAIPPGSLGNSNNSFQSAGPPGGGGGRPSVTAIGAAIASSGLSGSNSAIAPAAALAAVPATQQAQLNVATATPAAPDPQMAAGPLQGAGVLQEAGPLQGVGHLQSAGPLQSSGQLQNAGPLQNAAPLQNTAPESGPPGSIEGLTTVGGPMIPLPNDTQYNAAIYGPIGGPTWQQFISEQLGQPGGTLGPTLTSLVNTLAPPALSQPPFTPVSNPQPPSPPFPGPPGPLPPVIYDPATPQQQSPR